MEQIFLPEFFSLSSLSRNQKEMLLLLLAIPSKEVNYHVYLNLKSHCMFPFSVATVRLDLNRYHLSACNKLYVINSL